MKILYLSCHHVLEYDEIRLLSHLGHEVLSPGYYASPVPKESFQLRQNVPGYQLPIELADAYSYYSQGKETNLFKRCLPKDFVSQFDLLIAMHDHSFISENAHILTDIPIIWRSIGQSTPSIEQSIKKLSQSLDIRIARYSPRERMIDDYAGEDEVIRFAKFIDDYPEWSGKNKNVITFCQSMRQRGDTCNYHAFRKLTRDTNRHLYGPGNDSKDWMHGAVSDQEQKQILRDSCIYISCNTKPASYTLGFMEAWLTGIPIVALGKNFQSPYEELYEVPLLIDHGQNGFIVDDIIEGRALIKDLIDDRDSLERVSRCGREKAQLLFGEKQGLEQWRNILSHY